MSKQKFTVNVDIDLKDRTKNKIKEFSTVDECLIDIPMCDPRTLSPFGEKNKIFMINTEPVVNRVTKMSDGSLREDTGVSQLRLVGVKSEVIMAMSKTTHGNKDYALINGSIELPLDGRSERTELKKAYFTEESVANSVAMAILEHQIEKAEALETEARNAKTMLEEVYNLYDQGPKVSRSREYDTCGESKPNVEVNVNIDNEESN